MSQNKNKATKSKQNQNTSNVQGGFEFGGHKLSLKNAKLSYYFYLGLPIVFLLAGLLSYVLMGFTNTINLLMWAATILVFGILALPITTYFFRGFDAGKHIASKPIGILLTGVVVWTLTHIGIMRLNALCIVITMILMFILPLLNKNVRDNFVYSLKSPSMSKNMLFEEGLFLLVLIILCYFKGFFPDINGQEKVMDYGFLMTMLRADTLPANDMWLSGEKINYYYFGQYLYAMITKLCGIGSGYAYTISMCTSIALPFTLAYSIGAMLIELATKNNFKCSFLTKYVVGILAGFTTTIFGNSHSFFYNEAYPGNIILNWLKSRGVEVGRTDDFFYPDSTRFIGHNPDSAIDGSLGDYTIHEFPFYSYLVGDLHAHVISMIVVMTIILLCIVLMDKATTLRNTGRINSSVSSNRAASATATANADSDAKANAEALDGTISFMNILKYNTRNVLDAFKPIFPELVALGILLGIASMTNYWDFLIYFIVCAMTLLVYFTVTTKDFSSVPGAIFFFLELGGILAIYMISSEIVLVHLLLQLMLLGIMVVLLNYFPVALTYTTTALSFLFTSAHIVSLTFNLNFDMISNDIALVQNTSSPFQIFILWSAHLIITVSFIIYTVFSKNYLFVKGKKLTKVVANTGSSRQPTFGTPSGGYTNVVSRFFGEKNIADVFVCGLSVVGILMLIAPEIIYVRDIYTSGYLRSNTMFKFTFAAFILLSLSIAYIVLRYFWARDKKDNPNSAGMILSIASVVLLLMPAFYPFAALPQRSGELIKKNFKTLDGTAYLPTYASPAFGTHEEDPYYAGNLIDYVNVINWFNDNVEGTPVICEANGLSYTDYNMVSAYTGLPTVLGWQTHEWLWRFHGIVDEETDLFISDPENDVWANYLSPRGNDLFAIYTSQDPIYVRSLLDKYNVEYIILGDLEREKYGFDNSAIISQVASPAYISGNCTVYRVAR